VRVFGDDVVVCVNNLSRFPQAVELDLRHWEGAEPIEMTGGSHFPAIGELPYLLTLAGHGFYWLRIPQHQPPAGTGLPAPERPSHEHEELPGPGHPESTGETATMLRVVTDALTRADDADTGADGTEGVPG
jgi:hypothetical protein